MSVQKLRRMSLAACVAKSPIQQFAWQGGQTTPVAAAMMESSTRQFSWQGSSESEAARINQRAEGQTMKVKAVPRVDEGRFAWQTSKSAFGQQVRRMSIAACISKSPIQQFAWQGGQATPVANALMESSSRQFSWQSSSESEEVKVDQRTLGQMKKVNEIPPFGGRFAWQMQKSSFGHQVRRMSIAACITKSPIQQFSWQGGQATPVASALMESSARQFSWQVSIPARSVDSTIPATFESQDEEFLWQDGQDLSVVSFQIQRPTQQFAWQASSPTKNIDL
jgi:hypothetical protein